jgi:hypothetical protein
VYSFTQFGFKPSQTGQVEYILLIVPFEMLHLQYRFWQCGGGGGHDGLL